MAEGSPRWSYAPLVLNRAGWSKRPDRFSRRAERCERALPFLWPKEPFADALRLPRLT